MTRTTWIALGVVATLIGTVAVFAAKGDLEQVPVVNEIVEKEPPTVHLPAGTVMALRLETALSTESTRVGDGFQAVVTSPVMVGGEVAVPAGARVDGHVIMSEQPGKTGGRGRMQLAFDDVTFEGETYALSSRSRVYTGKSGKGKDIGLIGGGAIGGGIIGGIIGGDAEDFGKGALIGGAAGTAASLLTRGPQLVLPVGTVITFTLDAPLTVEQ